MNLRDLWLVMSIFFVQAIRHNLMPKKKLVVCFSCPIRNAYAYFNYELFSTERSVETEDKSVEFQFHGSFRSNLERRALREHPKYFIVN